MTKRLFFTTVFKVQPLHLYTFTPLLCYTQQHNHKHVFEVAKQFLRSLPLQSSVEKQFLLVTAVASSAHYHCRFHCFLSCCQVSQNEVPIPVSATPLACLPGWKSRVKVACPCAPTRLSAGLALGWQGFIHEPGPLVGCARDTVLWSCLPFTRATAPR